MRKLILKVSLLAVFFIGLSFSSCGGVDHSDPQSVADVALECYDMGDYAKLKTLVSPKNESLQKECDNMIQMAEKASEKYPDKVYEKKVRTFKSATEEFTGAELTDASHSADVRYEGDYPRRVILEKVDGKWYFERFK